MTFKTCADFKAEDVCAAPMCKWHLVDQTKPVDPPATAQCMPLAATTDA